MDSSPSYDWRLLAEINLGREPENQDLAAHGALVVLDCVRKMNLPKTRLTRLETAVMEAVTNLFRRSGPEQAPLPLKIRVFTTGEGTKTGPPGTGPQPEAISGEVRGAHRPRANGWGFFLVEKKADAAQFAANSMEEFEKFNNSNPPVEPLQHAVDVFLYLEGESASSASASPGERR